MANELDERNWYQHALATPSSEEQFIVDNCLINIRLWGDRSAQGILLVHGGGAHLGWWDHIAPMLAGDHCIAALDLSGHGDSGTRDKYSFEQWGKEVLAVAFHLFSTPPPFLIGHSLGGRVVAVAAANSSKEQLSGVIIVDSAFGPTWAHGHTMRERAPAKPRRYYPTAEAAVERFRLRPPQLDNVPHILDHVARQAIRHDLEGWTWKSDPKVSERTGEVTAETLSRVKCRIAIMRPENGRMIKGPRGWFQEVVGGPVPVVDIPLAHHHVMFDQPLSFITAINAVLAEWEDA